MWLLDANMDVHLLSVLSDFGIQCQSAVRKGWHELANGELVMAAAQAGFTCILTRDRLFAESAGQSLAMVSPLSIVVVRLPQKPWRDYILQFRTSWNLEPIAPSPGKVVYWPAA